MSNETKGWIKTKILSLCTKLEKHIISNKTLKCKVVFGPVRSRRLGLVLGIIISRKKFVLMIAFTVPS